MPKGVDAVALGGNKLLEQRRLSALLTGLWNFKAQRGLRDWIKANDTSTTIYHVHGFHQTLSPSVLCPLKRVKSRTVMHAHDYFLACPNGAFFDFQSAKTCNRRPLSFQCVSRNCDKRNYFHKLWRVARQFLQNKTRYRLLPDVVTVLIHEAMERRLFPQGAGGPVVPIANPAVSLLETPVSAERNADVVFVGDIHEYKGVFLLAEAGRRAGVPVLFAGAGLGLAQLKKQYPEHRYAGWQDRNGLRNVLSKARLLVAPTLGPEPFGLAPVEALLSGVPVAITDEMSLSQDIVSREMGRSFKAGDIDELTEVISHLANDDLAIARMSENASLRAEELSLPPVKWCRELCDVYAGLLEDAVNKAR
ncbi:glycosyltransferase family 4 protein [Rhodobacteraceae bacterium D3-12]|nr:glycosyltransferase family 4 protein [Rhodobacteraceae bacterium D3-12]